MIPLTMLWTIYAMLTIGGVWTSIAVKWGLCGLIMVLYIFCFVVIFFAKRLSAEIEKKSEKMESNELEVDKEEQEKEEPKKQLVTVKGESQSEIKTNELTSKEQRQRDKLIYDIILNRYDLEWKRNNDLDSKASGVVGFAGLLATLSAGIAQFVSNPNYRPLLYVPSVLFMLSVFFGLLGYGLGKYRTIEPNAFIEKYADKTETELLRTYVATASEMTMNNFRQNENKVKWIRLAFIALVVAIPLSFVIPVVSMMA
jgi:Ca2+/Na+ antiporter